PESGDDCWAGARADDTAADFYIAQGPAADQAPALEASAANEVSSNSNIAYFLPTGDLARSHSAAAHNRAADRDIADRGGNNSAPGRRPTVRPTTNCSAARRSGQNRRPPTPRAPGHRAADK